jgi:hypothetical protein
MGRAQQYARFPVRPDNFNLNGASHPSKGVSTMLSSTSEHGLDAGERCSPVHRPDSYKQDNSDTRRTFQSFQRVDLNKGANSAHYITMLKITHTPLLKDRTMLKPHANSFANRFASNRLKAATYWLNSVSRSAGLGVNTAASENGPVPLPMK